jgi:hypothetical protein
MVINEINNKGLKSPTVIVRTWKLRNGYFLKHLVMQEDVVSEREKYPQMEYCKMWEACL